jgi:hypothetical protein
MQRFEPRVIEIPEIFIFSFARACHKCVNKLLILSELDTLLGDTQCDITGMDHDL